MTDLVIRPIEPGEEDLFLSLPDPGLVGVASTGRDYGRYLAAGEYRPEWTWVALRDGRPVARAAWWGGPEDTEPKTLDWFDFLDPDAGAALLRSSPLKAEFCLIVPPGWRDRPEVRREAEIRIEVAKRTGMRPLVERLHYVWRPADGLPDRPARLEFRPEPGEDVLFEVFKQVHSDTMDAHARRTIAEQGLAAAAREEIEYLHWMVAPRPLLAYTRSGDLAGIVLPGHIPAGPTIGFVGVIPAQRGHGYGYDLLAEATHLLAEEGAERIGADTDTTNLPMAAAFAKAGYPITQERVFLV
jgi:RimJ/RimL family protein N-acetyltransferase